MKLRNNSTIQGVEASHFIIEKSSYQIKCGPTQDELRAIFRLRAQVFCEELKWVGPMPLETDEYDNCASYIAINKTKHLMGTLRILDHTENWMLEKQFRGLAPDDLVAAKTQDSCEVTRLAVSKACRNIKFEKNASIADALYQGLFVYCISNNIRYVYMVVSTTILRVLRMSGLPCEPISKPQQMEDGVIAVSAKLDWNKFIEVNSLNHSTRLRAYFDALNKAQFNTVFHADKLNHLRDAV